MCVGILDISTRRNNKSQDVVDSLLRGTQIKRDVSEDRHKEDK
jgi:hypothetical protein